MPQPRFVKHPLADGITGIARTFAGGSVGRTPPVEGGFNVSRSEIGIHAETAVALDQVPMQAGAALPYGNATIARAAGIVVFNQTVAQLIFRTAHKEDAVLAAVSNLHALDYVAVAFHPDSICIGV